MSTFSLLSSIPDDIQLYLSSFLEYRKSHLVGTICKKLAALWTSEKITRLFRPTVWDPTWIEFLKITLQPNIKNIIENLQDLQLYNITYNKLFTKQFYQYITDIKHFPYILKEVSIYCDKLDPIVNLFSTFINVKTWYIYSFDSILASIMIILKEVLLNINNNAKDVYLDYVKRLKGKSTIQDFNNFNITFQSILESLHLKYNHIPLVNCQLACLYIDSIVCNDVHILIEIAKYFPKLIRIDTKYFRLDRESNSTDWNMYYFEVQLKIVEYGMLTNDRMTNVERALKQQATVMDDILTKGVYNTNDFFALQNTYPINNKRKLDEMDENNQHKHNNENNKVTRLE